jgi:hypothetical protein
MRCSVALEAMPNATTKRGISAVLVAASLALFVRGIGYYSGPGPHDGEDLPSLLTFVAGSAALFAAVLVGSTARQGGRGPWVIGLCLSGVMLLTTVAWWALNVRLERWAS